MIKQTIQPIDLYGKYAKFGPVLNMYTSTKFSRQPLYQVGFFMNFTKPTSKSHFGNVIVEKWPFKKKQFCDHQPAHR